MDEGVLLERCFERAVQTPSTRAAASNVKPRIITGRLMGAVDDGVQATS